MEDQAKSTYKLGQKHLQKEKEIENTFPDLFLIRLSESVSICVIKPESAHSLLLIEIWGMKSHRPQKMTHNQWLGLSEKTFTQEKKHHFKQLPNRSAVNTRLYQW